VVTFRAMTDDDVPAAAASFGRGLLDMQARFRIPVTGSSIQEERRRLQRTRHLLHTDPDGAWVADEDGNIVGMAQASLRGGHWDLSQLSASPGLQGRGIGRELLKRALAYGEPDAPRMIQCSRDPRAMALYTSFGFALHPALAGWGTLRPRSVSRPPDVRRCEADEVGAAELALVDEVDRVVRGSTRAVDIVAMLEQPGAWLLLHEDQAYAVATDDRVVALGARQEESAALVLRTMLAEAPPGEVIEVAWLTAGQQWAIREVVAAGIELQSSGPIMVRGMATVPTPYIPSGGFG
jgi:ribosomal protein S18 acetylase RimI-like enzyme